MDRDGCGEKDRGHTPRTQHRARPLYLWVCLMALASTCAGQANLTCPEPEPVGNAYRTFDLGRHQVSYECFETYVLTEGNTTRTCIQLNDGSYAFTGTAPVCTLDCRGTRNETSAMVVSVNETLALDEAYYRCSNDTEGTVYPAVICSARLGAWNHSALDCHGPSNILQMENVALDPSPTRNTTVDLHLLSDDNMTSSLTFDTNSTMTFNISDYGNRMEVTSVKLVFTFNVEDPYPPCRTTTSGEEYAGFIHKQSGLECQRWGSQSPYSHNYTDDSLFPGDGSVSGAENYCRNPGGGREGPWCYTTSPTVQYRLCSTPACVQLQLTTTYVNMNGWEQVDVCSDQPDANSYYGVLNNAGQQRTKTIVCRSPEYAHGILPFGHHLTLAVKLLGNATLTLHEMAAFGRPYTEGCGPVKGYHNLVLVGEPPQESLLGTNVSYSCRPGWHYRGGDLLSFCTDARDWSEPDVTQCTDEPNHSEEDRVSVRLTAPTVSSTYETLRAQGCLTPSLSASFSLTIDLVQLVEVKEVVIEINSTDGNDNTVLSLDVVTTRGSRSWPCSTETSVGPVGTFMFTCPFRAVSEAVVVSYERDASNNGLQWKICDVKIFGRPFSEPVECLQTTQGQDYKGSLSFTASGAECQRWDSQSPHAHSYNTSHLFPDMDIHDAHNYCRNPVDPTSGDIRQMPWCYTNDSRTEWEYCPIFYCDSMCLLREDGVNYVGHINVAASGNGCHDWYNQQDTEGQYHFMRNHYFPTREWASSRCQNPHGSQALPWCFTARPPVAEYCDIPSCPLTGQVGNWTLLEPEANLTLPDWLGDQGVTIRECWTFQMDNPQRTDRFTALSSLLRSRCKDWMQGTGVFCDFLTSGGTTVWHHFWYNCSTPTEVTTVVTVQTTEENNTTSNENMTSLTTENMTSSTTGNLMMTTTTEMMTVTMTTIPSCTCQQVCNVNLTQQQLQQVVQQIKSELLVDTSKLSATVRKKTSAHDSRPSAVTTGSLGIVLIVATVGFVIGGDVVCIIQYFSNRALGGGKARG